MTSIRKYVYAALLAAAALNFAPSRVSAEEPAKGKFTLTHDVFWGNAKLPAGDYQFAYNTGGVSPVLILTKISGAPAGYMVLARATENRSRSLASRLVLATSPEGSYVSAMELPEFGMALEFSAPTHTSGKQLANAAAPTSAGQ